MCLKESAMMDANAIITIQMHSLEFIRPPAHARQTIEGSGVSISEWARENGFAAGLVYAVLNGKRKCLRGQSYCIAVALGLRRGEPLDVRTLSAKLSAAALLTGEPASITQEAAM
jgi:gp16 family phage-associated protein